MTAPPAALILRYMPKYLELDRMFHALGDGSRRDMVERLSRGPASVSELARPFERALPTVVQHLGVLEKAGIARSYLVPRSGWRFWVAYAGFLWPFLLIAPLFIARWIAGRH